MSISELLSAPAIVCSDSIPMHKIKKDHLRYIDFGSNCYGDSEVQADNNGRYPLWGDVANVIFFADFW